MAIRDWKRKPYIVDRDTNVKVGIDLPIRRDDIDGFFATTSTTVGAVRNNIKNLLNTHQGERLMQPNLGINLRKYLFEQLGNDMVQSLRADIVDTIKLWLPFVNIRNVDVKSKQMPDNADQDNTLMIRIDFNINHDPNTLSSVQLNISNNDGEE
tara:strand:+ start:611 stop:1072 length:462 start_codon:yes stop_codon:yes gene_type:complete